jgi:hypothetical protein
MKLPLAKLVLTGILIAGILMSAVRAQPEANRPPGVPIENWISISESAGIVIGNVPRIPTRYRFDPRQPGVPIPLPPGANTIPYGVQSLPGVLMAKHGGVWIRVETPMPPAQLQPLHH